VPSCRPASASAVITGLCGGRAAWRSHGSARNQSRPFAYDSFIPPGALEGIRRYYVLCTGIGLSLRRCSGG